MRIRVCRCVCVLALVLSSTSRAWDGDGHRIIADIAARHLTAQASAQVARLLGPQSMADVAPWADAVRDARRYHWSAPLHYANVAPDAETFDMQRDCPNGRCVVGAIVRFTHVLRNARATDESKIEAIKFLIHFVGDLHQPLHISRARDRGGNDIAVEFFHQRTNVHEVWDTLLLRRAHKPWSLYARELDGRITDTQRTTWARLNPPEWATESWRLAKSNAYTIPADGQLGQAYYETNLPVAEQRLEMAGVRLAALLNAIFGDGAALADMIPASATSPASAPATPQATTQPASSPAASAPASSQP